MKTKTKVAGTLVGLAIAAAVLIVVKISGVPKYPSGLDMRMDCSFDNIDLFEVTNIGKCDLSRELPMGVEVDFSFTESRKGKSRRFSLKVSSMTKRDILDEIIRQNPGYSWKEQDGIVNIRPYQTDANSKTVSPLDMTIPRFEVHQVTPFSALEYLRRLGQEHNIPITTGFYEIALQQRGALPDPGKPDHPEAYEPRQLIDVVIPHEVSIRDCLNAIVLANPPAYWRTIKWYGGKTALHLSSSQQGYGQEKNIDMSGSITFSFDPEKQ